MRSKVKPLVGRLFSRLVLTCTLLLLQIIWLFVLANQLAAYSDGIRLFSLALSVVMCLVLIRKDNTAPEFKISWMVVFMVMPLQGGLLYLLWGDKRPAWRMRRRLERAERAVAPLRAKDCTELLDRHPEVGVSARYLQRYGAYPVCENTEVKFYPLGEDMFSDMLRALRGAKRYIFIESFIIGEGRMWGAIHEILREKAAAGLDVRVIYDDAGCLELLPLGYWRELEAEGIHSFSFNPFVPWLNLVMNNRDHRKIMVVDGETAFTGGVNLADEYINEKERFGHWKDHGVRLTGDGAWSMTTMFLAFWQAQRPARPEELESLRPPLPAAAGDGLVQPFADSPVDGEPMAKNVCLDMIAQARRRLYICTPYLILDNDTLGALCLAAKCGVDVRIYTPGIPDKKLIYQLTRSYFLPLLQAGVKIYSYTPGFLHAKTWLCDDRTAMVGSVNLDYRSLYLHFECGTVLYGSSAIRDIVRDMQRIESQSKQIFPDDCRDSFIGTMISAILRMLAPLC